MTTPTLDEATALVLNQAAASFEAAVKWGSVDMSLREIAQRMTNQIASGWLHGTSADKQELQQSIEDALAVIKRNRIPF